MPVPRIRTVERGFIYQEAGVLTDELGRTATITTVDIVASNGVIHIIDGVLLPDGNGDNDGDDDDDDDDDDETMTTMTTMTTETMMITMETTTKPVVPS